MFWGLGLQFIFGILVIRTEPGFNAFQWLGDQIQVQGIACQGFMPLEPREWRFEGSMRLSGSVFMVVLGNLVG